MFMPAAKGGARTPLGPIRKKMGQIKLWQLNIKVFSKHFISQVWKLWQGLFSGFEIKWQWSYRRGRLAVHASIQSNAPSNVKKARERFLNVHSARLFNILPKFFRNEHSADFPIFKNHLDIFVARIPGQPTTTGLSRAAMANSLLDQVPSVPD